MLLALYASCFRAYKAVFRPRSQGAAATAIAPSPEPVGSDDGEATLLGDAYRGSGVLVGVLGALIIFCAVAPFGFGLLGQPVAHYFGFAEVVLMLWVIQTLYAVKADRLKERWIAARQSAEESRCRPLRESTGQGMQAMCGAVESLLDGAYGQIAYNRSKHDHYHAMEHAAGNAAKVGFGISLLAAIAHLVLHYDALIFLTAFLPAAVGALHGINSFLRLERLADDHLRMAEELESCRERFLRARNDNDLDSARKATEDLYILLTRGHAGWQEIAQRLEVRAP